MTYVIPGMMVLVPAALLVAMVCGMVETVRRHPL